MLTRRHKVAVIGAGPGGLTAAMILASRGIDVTVFEKLTKVGGRNSSLEFDGFKFDVGPTFLMMKFLLDEVFIEAGRRSEDYLKFIQLEPMYRLQFPDFAFSPTTDQAKMADEIRRAFPGQEKGLAEYYRVEKRRFERMLPCLQKDYSSVKSLFSADLLRALPRLSLGRTLFSTLGDYFDAEKLRLSFTFQSKYIGMSPWECPGAFGILSYIEHAFGVFHTIGGLSSISEAMAKVAVEHGATIRLSSPVKRIISEFGIAKGVLLEDGERFEADDVIIGSDFGHSMSTLFEPGQLRKYAPDRLAKMGLSCSTYMLYLGLDKVYDAPHHLIAFARDYRKNVEDIFINRRLSSDTSFYVRNASVNDPTLAPEGKSAIYVLVPTTNTRAGINWSTTAPEFREIVLNAIESRTEFSDIRRHIVAERAITPTDWRDSWGVYEGATFNLAHSLGQMLYFRPHNRFEELQNCYVVGGGTHPGSGMPTIVESGRISANLLCRARGIQFTSFNVQV